MSPEFEPARQKLPYKPFEHTDFVFFFVAEGKLLTGLATLVTLTAVVWLWLRSRRGRA